MIRLRYLTSRGESKNAVVTVSCLNHNKLGLDLKIFRIRGANGP